MINEVIKLVAPRRMEIVFQEEDINNDTVIIKPLYLSICAADQRYYTGKRSKEILEKKLPLSLIHEAVGEVMYDAKNEFKIGDRVVLIPNTPNEKDSDIKENYLRTSTFRSSSEDGFLQHVIFMRRDRIINIKQINLAVASLIEPVSISINAIEEFIKTSHTKKDIIGIWGCGSVGYITALVLKKYLPKSKIIVFGTNEDKLNYFSFVDDKFLINQIPKDLKIDHAFECVGGKKSENALGQIIDTINPQGTISLLGVSEEPISIDTRMILEKGLTLIGNSRSGYDDFFKAVEIMQDEKMQDYLENIISATLEINDVSDIYKAFDEDLNNQFKTVLKWNI